MTQQSAIALASYKKIYDTANVKKALDRLPESASESLRKTYQRMIEAGPDRFCIKPSGAPAMTDLYQSMPNFSEALDEIRRQVALAASSNDHLEIYPMLLLGDPGVGKTHFGKAVSSFLSTGFGFCPMSSMTAGWILSGASSQWKSAKPGKVFESLTLGDYANPVMLVDEIDKASGDGHYDPLGPLYSLLERDTAAEFVDEFAEVPVDASSVVWICTANDESRVPAPLLSRMNVFWIDPPDEAGARWIAESIYQEIRASKEWGARFDPAMGEPALERALDYAPREMRKAIARAFGEAHLDGRSRLLARDFPARPAGAKRAIGF